jgi:peptidoglycan hydrolase-like protein with peptidoglycan-binding domain
MASRGWTLAVDGGYGNQSEGVCRAFQGEKGLAIDGQVGPITWQASWTAPIS